MQNKSIERMVLLGFSASLSLFLLVSGIAWHSSRSSAEASHWVAHTHEVIGSLRQILSELYRAESSQRAYYLSGKENPHLVERTQALKDLQTSLEELEALTKDNQSQQRVLPQLRQAIQERRQILDAHLSIYSKSPQQGIKAIAGDLGTAVSQTAVVTQILADMRNEELRLLDVREAEAAWQHRLENISFLVLVPLLVLLLAFLFHRIRQDMQRRALAESEQKKLIAILDATPDLVAMATADKQMTYINKAGRKILGLTEDESLGQLQIADIHPQFGSENDTEDRFSIAIRTGSWRGETLFKMRDGKEIPTLQVVMAHQQADGSMQFSTIAHDISERQRNEEVLRQAALYEESHSRALALFTSSFERTAVLEQTLALLAQRHPFPASAIYLHDDWHGSYRCEARYGTPADLKESFRNSEGLMGEAAFHNRTIHLTDTSAFSGLKLETGVADLQPAAILIVPIPYKSRSMGVLSLAASRPLLQREVEFIERLVIQLGIALHNLKLYADTRLLAEQLRAGSEEIARKNAALEQASRTKSEFLANMSHELRTPLNAVVGFSEVLKDGLVGDLTPKQREYITDICNSGQHLLSLINDILDLSKVEAGKMELELSTLQLPSLLADSLTIIKEKATNRKIRLNLEIQPELTSIQADERKLKQVLYNLLSNALKFSRDQGLVTLRARRVLRAQVGALDKSWPNRALPLADSEHQEFIQVDVIDQGIGISEEGLEQLFQPFTQVDGGLARKFEGTGLGLMLVMRMVELHGGTIGVSSAEGQGSSFTLWLPLLHGVKATSKRPFPHADHEITHLAAAVNADASATWVLVVEDDDKAAELIRLQLEAEGLQVERARTAEEGLDLAKKKRFALVTLDILLPGMDGWDFLAKVKEIPETANLPVVIISIVADQNRGLSLGASAILQKPITQQMLMSTLDELGFASAPDKPLNVLVIDDDPRSVEIIASHLQRAKCSVVRAYGGKDGVNTALALEPDLIVLDLMMPEMSGFEVVEILKGDKRTAKIPVLVVTAKQIEQGDRDILNGHVMKIIEKSEFNHGRFISEIRRVLGTGAKGE